MIDSRALLIGTRVLTLALALGSAGAEAATKPSGPPTPASSPIQILPGTNSKEPISIDADKLVYFDKEQKAIYSGNVVVIQGDTKMTCSVMTVYLDRSPSPAANTEGRACDCGRPAGAHAEFGRQAARSRWASDGRLQDSGRHRRQWDLR